MVSRDHGLNNATVAEIVEGSHLSAIREKIKLVLGYYDDETVSTPELNIIINQSIESLESIILSANPNYFLRHETIKPGDTSHVQDIMANIRGRPLKINFLDDDKSETVITADQLFRLSKLSFKTSVEVVYHRRAKRLYSDLDKTDLSEFMRYIVRYSRLQIYEKIHNPMIGHAASDLQKIESEIRAHVVIGNTVSPFDSDLFHYEGQRCFTTH